MKLKTLSTIVGNMGMHRLGKCVVCGRPTIFVYTNSSLRNGMECLFCRSSSRNRHVAQVLLTEVAKVGGSIADLRCSSRLRIYNTDTGGPFFRALSGMPSYTCSGYFPDIAPGMEISPRVFCQDLEHLTFQDASFDVVITEDVLEHVRHHESALEEIHRVLKPGGCHVFTIPFYFDRPTLTRVDTSGSEDVHLLPPEYHGDTIRRKILAYRTLGIDLFDLLSAIGFKTRLHFSGFFDQRLGIFDSAVFLSRKV